MVVKPGTKLRTRMDYEGELGRMGIAFSSSKPNIVYAIIESSANAIYRSEDGGFTWEQRQTVKDDPDVGNRPFYYFGNLWGSI